MNQVTNAQELIDSIRKRPGMYTGGTDISGLHHLLYWVFDDILDNCRAGRGRRMKIVLNAAGGSEIWDDAPAVPLRDSSTSTLDVLEGMTGSFDGVPERGTASPEHVRSYLPILRALSKRLTITGAHDGRLFEQVYAEGALVSSSSNPGDRMSEHSEMTFSVRFCPDPSIFTVVEFDFGAVVTRLREMAATQPDIEISVQDQSAESSSASFTAIDMPGGMADVLREHQTPYEGPNPKEPFRLRVREGDLAFDVAIQWVSLDSLPGGRQEWSWANTVRTREGAHVLGLREALRATHLDRVPYRAALSVFVPQPRFSNPVKDCLRSPDIRRLIRDHLTPALLRLAEDDAFAIDIESMRV